MSAKNRPGRKPAGRRRSSRSTAGSATAGASNTGSANTDNATAGRATAGSATAVSVTAGTAKNRARRGGSPATVIARSYIAEFIGTAMLVIGGVGTAVLAGTAVGDLGIAIAFGFTLLFLVYAIGPISGCHVNPAVTLGLLATGKIGPRDAGCYLVAQILGGIAGAAVVFGIANGSPTYDIAKNGLGQNGWGTHSPGNYNFASAMIAEIVLTFFLVFVVLAATDRLGNSGLAGVAIGTCLTVIHLVGIPVTGTSVNPARSIGPALFAHGAALTQLWLFVLAPIVGGVIGGVTYHFIWGTEARNEDQDINASGR